MILVIAVIGLILPVLFNVIFTIVRQQVKIIALQEIKTQGDNALSSIETVIKSQAIGVYGESGLTTPHCSSTNDTYGPTDGTGFYFRDKNGRWFQYILGGSQTDPYIASAGSFTNTRLTNAKVRVSSFSISCRRTATYSAPIVTIGFTVTHKEGSSMSYNTRIKLRNY